MRNTLRALSVVVILAGLMSCQKEVTYPAARVTTPNPGGGTTGGATDSSYMPLVVGNWWKFRDTAQGTGVMTQTVTSRTIVFNGKNYSALYINPANGGADSSYFSHDSVNYYFLALINTGTANIRLEMMYLRDTTAGTTWSGVIGTVNGLTASIDASVIARDITHTVQGVIFNKVIHSHVVMSYAGIGTVATYDFYSAKGVGVIQTNTVTGFGMFTQNFVQVMTDHHLN
jgi:hypothetical protein